MKYRGKEYKNYQIMFLDGKPGGVTLLPEQQSQWHYIQEKGSIFTYWDNPDLTDKPLICL